MSFELIFNFNIFIDVVLPQNMKKLPYPWTYIILTTILLLMYHIVT
jgi:hypothetical protein